MIMSEELSYINKKFIFFSADFLSTKEINIVSLFGLSFGFKYTKYARTRKSIFLPVIEN